MNPELVAEAILGKDAEEFLNTELGRYLVGRAELEANEATEQLKRVHPWRRRKITELQNKIWIAESFQGWLLEMVIAGKQAMTALEEN